MTIKLSPPGVPTLAPASNQTRRVNQQRRHADKVINELLGVPPFGPSDGEVREAERQRVEGKSNPMHLSKSADWGTPQEVLDFARELMGTIDVDLASSAKWNRFVGAKFFFDGTAGKDTLSPYDYDARVVRPSTAFLNPPGDKSGQLVKRFWNVAFDRWLHESDNSLTSLFYLGFSLEQLVSLQRFEGKSVPNPLSRDREIWLIIPNKRLSYRRFRPGSAEPVVADQPTHGSFFAFCPDLEDARRREDQRAFWEEEGAKFGEIVK